MTRLFLFLSLVFFFTTLQSQELSSSQRERIDQIVQWSVSADTPGSAVGIVRGGEIVYEKYVGVEDVKSATPIDEGTVFNIASNGKQFTACLVLELIQQGQLQLGDDIRKFLPEILSAYSKSVTVQQLLNHSSGIRDVYDLWDIQGIVWWKTPGLSNAKALALLAQQQSPQFSPGTEYAYSNSNYLLLAEIIARITAKPFAAYAQERLKAWGLTQSFFLADHRQAIPNLAKPYFDFGKWYYYRWRSSLHGDGALFTTLGDQLKWEAQLQTQSSQSTFLSASQKALPIEGENRYGYGLNFGDYRGLPLRSHSGATGAWKAYFMRFPAQDLSIVVMTNSGAVNPPGVGRRIANALLEDEFAESPPFPLGPGLVTDQLDESDLPGTYALENNFYFRIVQNGDSWQLERPNRDPITIEKEEGDLFHEVGDPAFKQHFALNDEGEQTLTAYYPSHAPYTLTKLEAFPANFQAQQWSGKYRNVELGLIVQLVYEEEHIFKLIFRGAKRQKRSGQLISPTRMRAEGYGVEFLDVDGQQQLLLTNNRARGVQFDRIN